jgi:hypothetical protein
LALEECGPKTGSFACCQKKASSLKQADLRDMYKKASKNICASTVVVSPDPLSPTVSTSSAVKTLEHTEEDPHDSEPPAERDIQMECSSDQFFGPRVASVTKITCNNLGWHRFCLIIWNI